MKVLAVLHTPRSPHSAVYIVYEQLERHLRARGHTLAILTPNDFPRLRRLHPRWLPLVYPLVVDRWLQRRRSTFDLVSFHSYAGWRANLRRRRILKSITAFHGLEPLHYEELFAEMKRLGRPLKLRFRALHGWLLPRLIRLSCRRSDRVLCLNQTEAAYLRQHRWADPASVVVFSHGVSEEFFIDRTFAPEVSTLCFVGQWLERKGIGDLVEAFRTIAADHPALRLCCVGTLADPDHVRASFPAEVRSRVDVHPRVDHHELAGLYARADVFVLPTLFEGFSLALLEAMAARLPIVTTPVGAAPDLLENGQNAVLVPVRDPRALASALAQLLEDAALRERLGRAAQSKARNFTLERVNEHLLLVLTQVLAFPAA